MNEVNLNEVMASYFDQLKIDPISFKYIENKKSFVSTQPFHIYTEDPCDYLIVIKITRNIGTISIGYIDGNNYYAYRILGQIQFDGEKWINL